MRRIASFLDHEHIWMVPIGILATLEYFALLAAQHRGIWVGVELKPSNNKVPRDDINRMGSFLGPMEQTPAGAAPKEMFSGNSETARLYGLLVAQIAAKLFATDPQGDSLHSIVKNQR